MTKPLIFLGTNSVLERYIEACQRQNQPVAGIIDSDWYGNRETFAGLPILDSQTVFESDPDKYRDYVFFIGVNWHPHAGRDTDKRKMFIDLVKQHKLQCINLIDPLSYVSKYARLGQGIFIGSSVYVEPNCVIEDFALFHGFNGIGHDSHIGENTVFQRYAGIHGKIGHDSYVGIAGHICPVDKMITVGNNVIIAPCLHVARDVADNEKITLSKDMVRVYRHINPSI